jgi:hypothetical protein
LTVATAALVAWSTSCAVKLSVSPAGLQVEVAGSYPPPPATTRP